MSDGLEPAYVLHARPYRDTSVLLDLLGRHTGRFGAVARGARSDRSKYRGRLQPFTPLLVATVGRGELKTLTKLEFPGKAFTPRGDNLLLGLYVNELLYRLLGSFDPVTQLFDEYHDLLVQLADPGAAVRAVRWFELCVLQELGYGINFEYDTRTGTMIAPENLYQFVVDEGFHQAVSDHAELKKDSLYPGTELLHLASGSLAEVDEKRLLNLTRSSLARLLGEKPLKSRALFRRQSRTQAR